LRSAETWEALRVRTLRRNSLGAKRHDCNPPQYIESMIRWNPLLLSLVEWVETRPKRDEMESMWRRFMGQDYSLGSRECAIRRNMHSVTLPCLRGA